MPKQYELRDQAADKFLKALSLQRPGDGHMLRHAFNQGWAARKEAEYKLILGIDKPQET